MATVGSGRFFRLLEKILTLKPFATTCSTWNPH